MDFVTLKYFLFRKTYSNFTDSTALLHSKPFNDENHEIYNKKNKTKNTTVKGDLDLKL